MDSADACPEPIAGEGFTVSEAGPHDAELARLATLDNIAYDQQREAVAKRLGIRVSTLDEAVVSRRPMPGAATGRGVSLPTADPWPHPVSGADLLDGLATAIRRHVILRPAAADGVALWIAHTWVADRFQHSPRLGITSPTKRCGKSTLLDVLHATCLRPLKADNISASGVFRTVESLAPLTLLLDEADAFLAENEELRGVLNSGFERSGQVVRVVEIKGEWQPIQFRTFAPVALAGIAALPATLEDRAVPIVLQRNGAGETAVKLRAPGARAALAELASKAARWAADRGGRLRSDPAIPDAMGDREGDIVVPLLAIADDAAEAWPLRSRAALLDLFGRREADGSNVEAGGLLLADLRELFRDRGALRLPSADIVAALASMEDRPWPEWKQGKPMSAVQLARAVRPFNVKPENMRIGGTESVVKGYTADSFADAWTRYLAPVKPAETPVPRSKGGSDPLHRYSANNMAGDANPTRYTSGSCSGSEWQKTQPKQSCSGVADQSGGVGEEQGASPSVAVWSGSL